MMIPQNPTDIQQETLTTVLRKVPIVLVDSATEAYIFVKDLTNEMENFILTGRTEATTLNVFSESYTQELIQQWRSNGLKYKYRIQPFEYMHRQVTIKYLQVINPQTKINISLIPWFLLPHRPYPLFLYAYANWHYTNSQSPSMQTSAAVAGEIFGVSSFNKSTLSRNLKAMEQLMGSLQMDKPLSVNEHKGPSSASLIGRLHELLTNCPSIGSLLQVSSAKSSPIPECASRTGTISYALSQLPKELTEVVQEPEISKSSGKARAPKSQPKSKRKQKPRPRPALVDAQQIEQTRRTFISMCKSIALDAAITYHRFLI